MVYHLPTPINVSIQLVSPTSGEVLMPIPGVLPVGKVSIQLVSPTSGESSILNLIQRKMYRGHLRGLPKMSVQTPSQPMLLIPETLTRQYIEGSDELPSSQPFLSALASDIR